MPKRPQSAVMQGLFSLPEITMVSMGELQVIERKISPLRSLIPSSTPLA